jgi:hypothetical protein
VAVDQGCSWNQTPGDLQGEEEKTCDGRSREIILDRWIQKDTWRRSTYTLEDRHRKIRGEGKSKITKGEPAK